MQNQSDFLVVVDVQPAYHEACENIVYDIIEKMNNTEQVIIFFYIGRQLEGDSKYDVIGYLLENGLDENRIDGIRFIEKEYGFFRNWMDCGVPHHKIVETISYMNEHNIQDIKKFTDSDWKNAVGDRYAHRAFSDDDFYLPSFNQKMFKDKKIDNLELIGGGRYECLLEIDFFLKGLGKKTVINEELCYNRDDNKARLHKNNTKKHKY